MKINFFKYHGTGNDFILINNFDSKIKLSTKQIAFICDRHFGIGADGLMLLNKSNEYDFVMDYYNSDGSGATMCGNGGRCITAFAKKQGIIKNEALFIASDGLHHATIDNNNIVGLKMADVNEIQKLDSNKYFLSTGSPHFVSFENNVENIDVYSQGKAIRNSETYKNKGTNVNFVEQIDKQTIFVRTYERGVENETLSCGTGIVASAISFYKQNGGNTNFVDIKTKGGNLKVQFLGNENNFSEIYLTGPAILVFEGEIQI